jgi:hypothetical protein
MKSLTKILVVILAITSLIPLKVGILCLFDQSNALKFFGLELLSPDLEKILFVLGGFVLASIVMPILSIVWLIKGKTEGFTLAYIVGFIAFARGILTLINFDSYKIDGTRLTVTPIVIGFLISIVTLIASKQRVNKVELANK